MKCGMDAVFLQLCDVFGMGIEVDFTAMGGISITSHEITVVTPVAFTTRPRLLRTCRALTGYGIVLRTLGGFV